MPIPPTGGIALAKAFPTMEAMNYRGVEYLDVESGSGDPVEGGMWVEIRASMHLNRGEPLHGFWDSRVRFRLNDREILAGLRYAVHGMRVGGRRQVTIGPHLLFRGTGLPGMIPPRAVVKGEIELLAACPENERLPLSPIELAWESLTLRFWTEETSPLPRWWLSFTRSKLDGSPAAAFGLEWSTRSDGKWGSRTALKRDFRLELTSEEIDWFVDEARRLPDTRPMECLNDQVGSRGGESPTRTRDGTLCVSVSFHANGNWEPGYYLTVDTPAWTETEWGRKVQALVQPHLIPLSDTLNQSRHPEGGVNGEP